MTDEMHVPQAADAEHALLNLAITHPDLLALMVEDGLKADMFYDHHASFIFDLFVTLTEEANGAHPSGINVRSRLKANGNFEELSYYQKLYEEPQDRSYYQRNFNRVTNAYKKRQVLRHIGNLAMMCQDDMIPFEAILGSNTKVFEELELFGHSLNIRSGEALKDMMVAAYDTARDRAKSNPWGIKALDKATKGTRLGEFTLFKGMEGNGKSAFLQQAAYYRATRPEPRAQLWITIGDMTAEQIVNRLIQHRLGVPSTNLSEGSFVDKDGYDRQVEVYGELNKLAGIPFYIVEGDWMKSTDLKRVLKSALRLEKTFDVYIDYLQQFQDPGDPYEATSRISRNVRNLAHHLKDENGQNVISITAISGMNKDGEHFGAKSLAHDPENIFTISLEKQEQGKNMQPRIDKKAALFVEKQRGGAQQFVIDLWFEGRYTRFSQYDN